MPPPQAVQERVNVWSQAVKKQGKWTLDAIAKSICIVGLACNECNALDICFLRPNELEYHKQQEVLPC